MIHLCVRRLLLRLGGVGEMHLRAQHTHCLNLVASTNFIHCSVCFVLEHLLDERGVQAQ